MDQDGNNLLSTTILNWEREDGEIYYVIDVRFGTAQRWRLRKTYAEFAAFNSKAERKFGREAIPYFTGSVLINAKSDSNSEKRLPKLDEYLTAVLRQWPTWKPSKGFLWLMDHPDGVRDQKVRIHDYVKSFLEFDEHVVAVDRGREYDEMLQREAEAAKAEAILSAKAVREIKVQKGEMTEAEAHLHELKEEGLIQSDALLDPAAVSMMDPAASVSGAGGATANGMDGSIGATASSPRYGAGNGAASPSNASMSVAASSPKPRGRRARIEAKMAQAGMEVVTSTDHDGDGFEVVEKAVSHEVRVAVHTRMRRCSPSVMVTCLGAQTETTGVGSHVEYKLRVHLFGAQWEVLHRYSSFEKLHDRLESAFGEAMVKRDLPSFDQAFAPSWAKTDDDVVQRRQTFFGEYLATLVQRIDDWCDHLPLAAEKVANDYLACEVPVEDPHLQELFNYTDRKMLQVDFHRILADFLHIADHEHDLSGPLVQKALQGSEHRLPPSMKQDLDERRFKDGERTKFENFAKRSTELPGILSDAEVQQFANLLLEEENDRDAVLRVRLFISTGYYLKETSRQANVLQLQLAAAQQQGSSALLDDGTASALGGVTPSLRHTLFSPTQQPSRSRVQEFGSASNGGNHLNASLLSQLPSSPVPGVPRGLRFGAAAAASPSPSNFAPSEAGGSDTTVGASPANPRYPQYAGSRSASVATTSHRVSMAVKRRAETPCGLTSRHLALLVRNIPFDDTRQEIIKLLIRVLHEDVHLKDVLDTVLYDWAALETQVRRLLHHRDVPLSLMGLRGQNPQ